MAQYDPNELAAFYELAVQFQTQQPAMPINAALKIGGRHIDLTDVLDGK